MKSLLLRLAKPKVVVLTSGMVVAALLVILAVWPQPQPMSATGNAKAAATVAAGEVHTCTLTTAGSIKCWGYENQGQVGDGQGCDPITCATPVDLSGLSNSIAGVTAGFTGVFAGDWNGDGRDSTGVYVGDTATFSFYTPSNSCCERAQQQFGLANENDLPPEFFHSF